MSGSDSFQRVKEVLIRSFGFGRIAGEDIRATEVEMGERARRTIRQQPAMVEDFLEFGGGELALSGRRALFHRCGARFRSLPGIAHGLSPSLPD